ncbi:methionine synthase [Nakamurella antarctica]|uniref:Methionine synthase n=1 Tax=Nakamurella antarctica TaxID=1902245 RepID=A0A3G8ZJM3_9ACTN|nr:methionine synthase [Nakamurella antarctica]AZI57549.1 methionine synthase [Nakamurella antarctica]
MVSRRNSSELDGSPARPWHLGAATGLGPMPGTDPAETARIVAGEMPELPFLAELPGRGVGADQVGRTAGLLVDIYAEVVPSGWRISRRPTREGRRAKDFLSWDLDAMEQTYAGAEYVKIQICGPWTLAAMMEVPSGHRALVDYGAVDDVAASLAQGLSSHVADIERRLPGTRVVVQIDEPALPQVLAGTLPTASGFGTVRAVAHHRAGEILTGLRDAAGERSVVHCCDSAAPLRLLAEAGFAALATDFTLIGSQTTTLDALGELMESGIVFLAGTIPSTRPAGLQGADAKDSDPRMGRRDTATTALAEWAKPITEPTGKLGFSALTVAQQVVPTPTCGLANASADWSTRALTLSRDVARLLGDALN